MPEIQDIFSSLKPSSLSLEQNKAFYSIRNCRTDQLGSHVDRCDSCKNITISYNSCRNRHCPKCQGSKQKEWVQAQLSKLLPVGYFHLVFTLPHELNTLFLQNQKLLYPLLIKSAGDTITELAKDPKYLGAQTGVTAVLHTWGQNLSFHPHVHCIVPGGGLSLDGLKFKTSSKKFFLPVKVLSRKFRGKFLFYLKKAWNEGKIKLFNNAKDLAHGFNFLDFHDRLYTKEWVVHAKKPFKSPWHVINYLGRYTHKVAISNSRLISFDGTKVNFKWKDYKDKNRLKVMTLDTSEFVRRFMLHVLPLGFTRIRHYGILSSRNISVKLALCSKLLSKSTGIKAAVPEMTKYVKVCPGCGGTMVFAGLIDKATNLDALTNMCTSINTAYRASSVP